MKKWNGQKKNRNSPYNPLKIAMIGHKRIPSREGGVEIVVEELSDRLTASGHEVHAYNRSGHHVSGKKFDSSNTNCSYLKKYKGIRIITIPTLQNGKWNALIYSVFGTLRAMVGHYNIIHYHAEGPCAMLWLPHLFGIRTVATIHGLDWQRGKWGGFASKYLKFGEKAAAKYADEIIVLSKNIQNYFRNTYGREVSFIPNGIVRPVIKSVDVIWRKWQLQKDEYLLYLARIVPEKGLHYLIEAYRALPITKKLVIAGGSSHTDEYKREIMQKAAGDERIIFTDFIQGEELEELYSNAYLYILPSDLEGMPISLLEAMSYGNCCVVSDIPECLEVVEDMAVSFTKGDVTDLTKKLTWLMDNPDIVNAYKEKASDFICHKYDWDMVVRNTVELYQK
ncbi:MAG: glycosyltransferase family 4 protein [Herbinix sp.]|jgi:glycosyltransferase involved in cell wall biosynthesis|nr:glycosyltransferase family 4 protein [Herbinix sp.]